MNIHKIRPKLKKYTKIRVFLNLKKNKKEENGNLQEVLYIVIGVLFIVRMFFEDFSWFPIVFCSPKS